MLGLRYRAWTGFVLALMVSTMSRTAAAGAAPAVVPGRVLVAFHKGIPPERVRVLLESAGARSIGQIPQIGVHIVQLPPQASEVAAAHAFKGRPEVVFAEPDCVLPPD